MDPISTALITTVGSNLVGRGMNAVFGGNDPQQVVPTQIGQPPQGPQQGNPRLLQIQQMLMQQLQSSFPQLFRGMQ